MRKIALSLVLFFPFTVQLLEAQSLSVVYLEGQAELRGGTLWRALAIGDAVPLDSSIRLAEGSFLQLKGKGVELALGSAGIYTVKTILAAKQTASDAGVGAALRSSLLHLVFGPSGKQGTGLGARGANESSLDDGTDYVESSAQVFLPAGKEYLKAGKYSAAIAQFTEALDSASAEEAPEVHYLIAYAASLKGDVKEAWEEASGLRPNAGEPWYGDFLLLKAKLLEDTSAYADAASLLAHEGSALSQDAQRAPLYYLLLGVGYRGAGVDEQSRQALSHVVSISADSALGKAANELLSQPQEQK